MRMKLKYVFPGAILLGLAAVVPQLLNRYSADSPQPVAEAQPVPVQLSDRDRGVAFARRGNTLHEEKQYQAAIANYDSAVALLPAIRDWINVFAATSASFVGDTTEVARRLERVDSQIIRDWGWRSRVRAFAEAKASNRAIDIASSEATQGGATKRAAAWFALSELQRDLGNQSARRTALFRAIEAAPVAEGAEDAGRELAQFKDLTTSEYLQVGRSLVRNGEPRLGSAALRSFIEKTNNAELRDDVRFEYARTQFNIGEYRAAEVSLSRIAPKHDRAADARFLLGRAQYRQDKVKAGLATFRSVVTGYPNSVAATRALFSLGDLAQDDRRIADAVTYFKRTAARHQLGGEEPAEALMRLGGIQYLLKKYADAATTFETYRQRYARGVAFEQATYWAAQAASAAGKKDEARQLLETVDARQSFSYYDMRAAELLGKPIVGELPKGPAADTTRHAAVDSALNRWQLLRDIGWNEAAAFELRRLREDVRGNTPALYTIAESLNERDHAYAGIAIGRELLDEGAKWDARLLRIMYPLPYETIIKRESAANGLDPYFVAALMRQESRFNARAVSSAGAIGLMQVMPATGRQLGRVDREGLMDPEINIKLGTKFLADLMNTYDKRVDAVLAAYNAGPSRMSRWRSFPEFASPDLFVERIPFDETRDYVKVVRVNTSIYRALYAE